MRLFLWAPITALIVPLAAYAEAPKPVEVIDDRFAVEYVDSTPPSPPERWQFVGFTRATYTGAMGGYLGVTQKCQREIPNSRMCDFEEVAATTSISAPPVGEAWVHRSPITNADTNSSGGIFSAEIYASALNCVGWREDDPNSGLKGQLVSADRYPRENFQSPCDSEHPIACCALVP
jgi:hypothetical protein